MTIGRKNISSITFATLKVAQPLSLEVSLFVQQKLAMIFGLAGPSCVRIKSLVLTEF